MLFLVHYRFYWDEIYKVDMITDQTIWSKVRFKSFYYFIAGLIASFCSFGGWPWWWSENSGFCYRWRCGKYFFSRRFSHFLVAHTYIKYILKSYMEFGSQKYLSVIFYFFLLFVLQFIDFSFQLRVFWQKLNCRLTSG